MLLVDRVDTDAGRMHGCQTKPRRVARHPCIDPTSVRSIAVRDGQTGTMDASFAALPADADHRTAERAFTDAGWTRVGAGDWAIALRSPDGASTVRISPLIRRAVHTAELYRAAAHTRLMPELFAHRRLTGGGDLQLMEWLTPVDAADAHAFHGLIASRDEAVVELVDLIDSIHARTLSDLPWCGPLDTNPSNVMRGADGRLVVMDLFYADGPALYATAGSDPDTLVARIPETERRFLTEIPLAGSGPWDAASREEMRRGIAAADARRAAHPRTSTPNSATTARTSSR